MGVLFTNNASGTLAAGIGAGATALSLNPGQGALFPSPAGGSYFYATLVDNANNLEIVKCTNRVGDVLTVIRGQDGSAARGFSLGDKVELRLTAAGLNAKLDKDSGGTVSGPLVLEDALTVAGAATLQGTLEVQGNTTLGNAGGDVLTLQGTTIQIPNGVSFTGGAVSLGATTLTGTLTLAGDPAAALQPATKQYVDTGFQPKDATLTALAAVASSADKLIYSTGTDVFALASLTAFARTLLDDTDAATARATLGALDSGNFTGANQSLVANGGFQKFPGGLVLQWGSASASANGQTVVNFPTAFTSWSKVVVSGAAQDANAQDNNPGVISSGTASFTVYSARDESITIHWLAVGV